MLNYYQILGISATASPKEIAVAYRAKCKLLHPDVNPDEDTTLQMQRLNEAYHILSDESLRRQYDMQYGYADNRSSATCRDYAQWFYNAARHSQTYRQPSWYSNPIDDWYIKHCNDSKEKNNWDWLKDPVRCVLYLFIVWLIYEVICFL